MKKILTETHINPGKGATRREVIIEMEDGTEHRFQARHGEDIVQVNRPGITEEEVQVVVTTTVTHTFPRDAVRKVTLDEHPPEGEGYHASDETGD